MGLDTRERFWEEACEEEWRREASSVGLSPCCAEGMEECWVRAAPRLLGASGRAVWNLTGVGLLPHAVTGPEPLCGVWPWGKQRDRLERGQLSAGEPS